MCLVSHLKTSIITQEDIICYKVLKTDGFSLYQNEDYSYYIENLGKIKEDLKEEETHSQFGLTGVYGGFIHSYSDTSEGLNQVIDKINIYQGQVEIYKCIIPKGTKFFISFLEDKYCSKRIKFVEEVSHRNFEKCYKEHVSNY